MNIAKTQHNSATSTSSARIRYGMLKWHYMDKFSYTAKIHPAPEGGYWAEVPALPGCFTQGETVEEVTAMVHEAIELYLAGLAHRGEAFPVEKRSRKTFAFPVSVRTPRTA